MLVLYPLHFDLRFPNIIFETFVRFFLYVKFFSHLFCLRVCHSMLFDPAIYDKLYNALTKVKPRVLGLENRLQNFKVSRADTIHIVKAILYLSNLVLASSHLRLCFIHIVLLEFAQFRYVGVQGF